MLFASCTAVIATVALAFLLLPMCQYLMRWASFLWNRPASAFLGQCESMRPIAGPTWPWTRFIMHCCTRQGENMGSRLLETANYELIFTKLRDDFSPALHVIGQRSGRAVVLRSQPFSTRKSRLVSLMELMKHAR